MINRPLAAGVAFFAMGVTFFGTALLVFFNPRSRALRWFALFEASIVAWLALQGWSFAGGDWRRVDVPLSVAVHLAPGLFLAFPSRRRSARCAGRWEPSRWTRR